MTTIVRQPYLKIWIDGQEVTKRFSATCSLGFDLLVSEATISVPEVPSWAKPWSVVQINMGANEATSCQRFEGFLIEADYTFYPRQINLICRGPLIRCQLVECSTSGGQDLSNGGAGQTDQAIVQQLLNAGGLTDPGPVPLSIGGLGRTLGTVAGKYYVWAENQSALDMISQIDQISLGYRTFDTVGGGVTRRQITTNPAATAALTFTEGVDIESATSQTTVMDTCTRSQVTGYDPGTGAVNYTLEQSNPLMPLGYVTEQLSSNLIESSTTGGTGISAEEVATWRLGEVNRVVSTIPMTTPRDDLIAPGTTIAVQSPYRMGVNQNFWVQRVDTTVDDQGAFSQQLTVIGGVTGFGGSGSGGLGPLSGGTTGPNGGTVGGGPGTGTGTPTTGGNTGGGGSQGNTPTNTPPVADFSLVVQSEQVLLSGSPATLYEVLATSTSTGTSAAIASYAWSCASGTVSSGTEDSFTTALTSITGSQTVTLTVTDANGLTASSTQTIQAPATGQVVSRPLYLAGTTCIEAFDGASWHTHSETYAKIVANAPLWGDPDTGAGEVWVSDASLSSISAIQPFGADAVTALWVETNINAKRILAGSDTAKIAVSNDGGATWALAAAPMPDGNAVLRCVISGSHPSQWFALTAAHLYRTDNAGAGWAVVATAGGGESFTDFVLSFARNMIVMAGGRGMVDFAGNTQTLPGGFGDVIAVCAHLTKDRFYVLGSSGGTAYHATTSATSLTAGHAIPAGSAQPRGLWRDSRIVDVVYVACGSGGVYKSIDGLKTLGGYFPLRQPGNGSAPSGAVYTQIGADGLLVVPKLVTSVTVLSSTATKALSLWNGSSNNAPPAGWQEATFTDSSWGAAVHVTGSGVTPPSNGSTQIWAEEPSPALNEQILLRTTFTVGAGLISAVTIYFACEWFIGIWLNGVFVPGSTNGSGLTVNLPTDIVVPGTNILCVQAYTPNSPSILAFLNFRLDIS